MGFIRNIIQSLISKFGYKIVRSRTDANLAYYCKALTGMSSYNISINSDLTVSCNCNDVYGQGIIGDIGEKTLKEIFSDTTAKNIRKNLTKGKMPFGICTACPELAAAPKHVAGYYENNFHVPTDGIMIENCSLCNYQCKFCNRRVITRIRKENIISCESMRKIADEIYENRIERISLFKLGEPFMDKDIYEKIKIIREKNTNIFITTSTNGMLLDGVEKIKAALLLDEITFSIDGINTEIQNKYQIGADYPKIIDNVKNLIKERGDNKKPIIIWKYVVFRWNDSKEQIEAAFAQAKAAGFDKILFTHGSTALHANARSERYYDKSFIPENIECKLERFIEGYGMLFDLSKKNGA